MGWELALVLWGIGKFSRDVYPAQHTLIGSRLKFSILHHSA